MSRLIYLEIRNVIAVINSSLSVSNTFVAPSNCIEELFPKAIRRKIGMPGFTVSSQ
jgi:hypothetical protein